MRCLNSTIYLKGWPVFPAFYIVIKASSINGNIVVDNSQRT